MEIRTAQEFSRSREEEREDPDIGLPATYQAGTEPVQGQGQEEGEGQAAGREDRRQRVASRERWSFSPPRHWAQRPSRPYTRSVADRRQRNRDRVQHTAEGRQSGKERR